MCGDSHIREVLERISDKHTIAILEQLRQRDNYANDLAEVLDMAKSTVWDRLKKLEKLDLIESYYTIGNMGRRVKMYKFKEYQFPFITLSQFLAYVTSNS